MDQVFFVFFFDKFENIKFFFGSLGVNDVIEKILTSAKKLLQIFVQNKFLYKCSKFHDIDIFQSKVMEGGAPPPPPSHAEP